ncbi:hypothetical protein ABK905_03345 [Acerihabitans sp. KWT182]|uniref:Adhesin domain-containing protein n=1 Tax=Acerihabitans sp. KWT182 TaxID=3157919 RepID=A0AAU7QAY7_9GAMM
MKADNSDTLQRNALFHDTIPVSEQSIEFHFINKYIDKNISSGKHNIRLENCTFPENGIPIIITTSSGHVMITHDDVNLLNVTDEKTRKAVKNHLINIITETGNIKAEGALLNDIKTCRGDIILSNSIFQKSSTTWGDMYFNDSMGAHVETHEGEIRLEDSLIKNITQTGDSIVKLVRSTISGSLTARNNYLKDGDSIVNSEEIIGDAHPQSKPCHSQQMISIQAEGLMKFQHTGRAIAENKRMDPHSGLEESGPAVKEVVTSKKKSFFWHDQINIQKNHR